MKFTVTCWLFCQIALLSRAQHPQVISLDRAIFEYGGIVRMDTTEKVIFLTFSGGDYGEGLAEVRRVLRKWRIQANFFFTGDFYRNPTNRRSIRKLKRDAHYLGAHGDKHLLYMPWSNRDSLLVDEWQFKNDLLNNYEEMKKFKIRREEAPFFLPPYEWYNDSISSWTTDLGLQLINYTPGTRSNADYTTPDLGSKYIDSSTIMESIFSYEESHIAGLNGFILLMHVGTHPDRTNKFYGRLPELILKLRSLRYDFGSLHSVH